MVQSKADIENPAIAVTARALQWKQPRLWEDFPGSLPSTAHLNDRWVFLPCGGASEAFMARAGGSYLLFLVREPLPRWTDCTWRNPQISHFKVYPDHKLRNILINFPRNQTGQSAAHAWRWWMLEHHPYLKVHRSKDIIGTSNQLIGTFNLMMSRVFWNTIRLWKHVVC